MSVPSQIEHVLKNNNVPYQLAEMATVSSASAQDNSVVELRAYNAARAVVLRNTKGEEVIAISSRNKLLDINRVDKLLASTHSIVCGEELQRFMTKCGVDSIPALPGLNNLATIVDNSLLEYDNVYLDVGAGSQYIKLQQESFQQLLNQATIGEIVTPFADLNPKPTAETDKQEIEKSVSAFTERRVHQRLEETLEFPPLPATAEQIIRLRVDANADVNDLTSIVELDPSLSAQVVSWAASPYYSAPGSIKSIHDAIVRVLGFDMVLNLALGLALGNTLKMPKEGPHSSLPYWQQSVYTAAATEALVTCIPRDQRPSFGTAYLAGLLNNFGYLIIAEVFNTQFKTICDYIDANPHASVIDVERQILGVDRHQLASWLMGYWNMPETVVTALRHQGNPDYDGVDWQYSLLIYLANKMLRQQGYFTGASLEPIPEELFQRLSIDRQAAEEAITNLLESHDDLQNIAAQMSGAK